MGRHISDEFGTPQRPHCDRRQVVSGPSQIMTARVVADLGSWSKHTWTDGLQVDALQDLETLCVRTRNSTYEITVLSGRTAEVLVRGGQFFPSTRQSESPAALSGGASSNCTASTWGSVWSSSTMA